MVLEALGSANSPVGTTDLMSTARLTLSAHNASSMYDYATLTNEFWGDYLFMAYNLTDRCLSMSRGAMYLFGYIALHQCVSR